MAQTEILKLLEKNHSLMASEIILKLRKNGETREYVRLSLKKLRKYKEVGFILINAKNQHELSGKFPNLDKKIEEGYKVRRPTYMYFRA